jgi:hypothetical protein
LLQLVASDEIDWMNENAAAFDSFQKQRLAEAAKSFARAVQLAEKFGPDDERLGQSLAGLVETYHQQQDYASAAPVQRRILAIRWSGATKKATLPSRRL